jgi:ferredoxin-NADP reductase
VAYQYFDCEVTDIVDATERTKRFFFRFPKKIDFSFRAGQFVMLDLPIKSNVTNRAYSIASAPDGNNSFELVISKKPEGLGTTYLFNEVKPGSILQVTMALGKFGLPEPIEHDLCFVCTGTGIAPLRSMLLTSTKKIFSIKTFTSFSETGGRQIFCTVKNLKSWKKNILNLNLFPCFRAKQTGMEEKDTCTKCMKNCLPINDLHTSTSADGKK